MNPCPYTYFCLDDEGDCCYPYSEGGCGGDLDDYVPDFYDEVPGG